MTAMATTVATVSDLPEYIIARELQVAYEGIRSLIPAAGSDTIKVSQRKKAIEHAGCMSGAGSELCGVVKVLRHELTVKCEEIEVLKKIIAKMEIGASSTAAQNAPKPANNRHTYAAAARPPVYPVLVEPMDKSVSSDETMKLLKSAIDPAACGLSVTHMNRARNGGIVVNLANKEDAEKVKLSLSAMERPTIRGSDIKRNRPRIILPMVEASLEDAELIKCLLKQNERIRAEFEDVESLQKDATIKFKSTYRRDPVFKNVIMEVSPKLRRLMCGTPTNLNWQRVYARDHVSLLQCYRCYEYGHKSAECKDTQKCGYCAGEHEYKQCKSETPICIVCKRANMLVKDPKSRVKTCHDARASECPTTRRMINAIVRSIDYHGQ